jgi:UPF0176 protein
MITVAAFYCFAPLPDVAARRGPLLRLARRLGLRGSVLLAAEGVNGTIAGEARAVETVLAHLRDWPGCAGMPARLSEAAAMPFGRMKVRLKREIVTMGHPGLDPAEAGTRVAARDWNDVVRDPETAVIDVRNAYEVRLGSFPGAVDPGTATFGDFPAWWRRRAEGFAGRRVAMFCTGGIRCEKSTAFLRAEGVDEVLHLEGGVLSYLEAVPAADSLWRGRCFVFDDRVSVGHGLAPGDDVMCRACRRPVRATDTARPEYEEGVACHLCVEEFGPEDRARFRERMRQMRLAEAAGRRHLGAVSGG